MVEPSYPVRRVITKLDDYAETLRTWLKADAGRNKRERRTKGQMWLELCALGYTGGYGRVCAFARAWKASMGLAAVKGAFIPLKFQHGEAFQFDWSTEYTFIGGLRRRVCAVSIQLRCCPVCGSTIEARIAGCVGCRSNTKPVNTAPWRTSSGGSFLPSFRSG